MKITPNNKTEYNRNDNTPRIDPIHKFNLLAIPIHFHVNFNVFTHIKIVSPKITCHLIVGWHIALTVECDKATHHYRIHQCKCKIHHSLTENKSNSDDVGERFGLTKQTNRSFCNRMDLIKQFWGRENAIIAPCIRHCTIVLINLLYTN